MRKFMAPAISHFPSTNCSFLGSHNFPSCSGKIVSPKWKSFKGLRLLWRDKIRLNNAIWRAWFIQCKRTARLRNPLVFLSFPYIPISHIFWAQQVQICKKISTVSALTGMKFNILHWWNVFKNAFATALFRCGEEEEPSVRVHHATGWLRSWFTSKAWGDLIV